MRRGVCLTLLVLVAVVVPGCDTDDPLLADNQNIQISMTANGASTDQYDVWSLFEDNDNDGVPDDSNGDGIIDGQGDLSLWCERTGGGSPGSVPWGYAMRIKVLRNGQTVAEQMTSDDAATDDFNRAPYDTDRGTHTQNNFPINVTHAAGTCTSNPLKTCNPATAFPRTCGGSVCNATGGNVTRRFKWSATNRRKLTAASRDVLRSTFNFISDACEGDAACASSVQASLGGATLNPALGVCPGTNIAGNPGMDPGNPRSNFTDTSTTFGLGINKGDTVLVEARRSNVPPDGGIPFTTQPGLRFQVRVGCESLSSCQNGALLQSDEVVGNLISDNGAASPNVSFSFTAQ